MAVDGGENLADRLRLVGVEAQPEGTGCLLYFISLCPEGGKTSDLTMLSIKPMSFLCVLGEREQRMGTILVRMGEREPK